MILHAIKALYTIAAVIWQPVTVRVLDGGFCVNMGLENAASGHLLPVSGVVMAAGLVLNKDRLAIADDIAAPCAAGKAPHHLRSVSGLQIPPHVLSGLAVQAPSAPAQPKPPAAVPPPVAPVIELQEPSVELPAQAAAKPLASQSFAAASRDLVAIMTLPSGQAQPQERLFAGDALVGILPYLPATELAALTRTVARLEVVSEKLRSFLVCHPDRDISCRMLKDAQNLSDVDLLRLVPKANDQQLRLMARRRNLSTTVCDAIIGTGNKVAILDVLRNPDCVLSQNAFEHLQQIIGSQQDMLSALCNRADIPQAVGLNLFWQANQNLRRYILSRFLTESASLGRVMDVGISAGAIPPIGGQARPADIEMLVAQIESGSADAASTLASVCRISPETAQMIVSDTGGEPLSVVFKALAQSRLAMAEALKRWVASPNCALSGGNRILELHALFDSLSYNKARMLLAYWDWAAREAGPYTEFAD